MKLSESEEAHKKKHPPRPATTPARTQATNAKTQLQPRFHRQTPCGLHGCPVRADHEGRLYGYKEPSLPNLIKKIVAMGFEAPEAEYKTQERFFDIHNDAWKQADGAKDKDLQASAYVPVTVWG